MTRPPRAPLVVTVTAIGMGVALASACGDPPTCGPCCHGGGPECERVPALEEQRDETSELEDAGGGETSELAGEGGDEATELAGEGEGGDEAREGGEAGGEAVEDGANADEAPGAGGQA